MKNLTTHQVHKPILEAQPFNVPQRGKRYAIITPVRNEEKHIEKLIQSLIQQTVLPIKWIVLNDGSTDRTAEIIEEYAREHPFIHLINLPDRGKREPGGDTVFEIGLKYIDLDEIDYLARIDGDVSFAADYFENMIEEFSKSPRLGIASGEMAYLKDGIPLVETGMQFQTHGPCKFYRVACFKDIGGLHREIGWDVLDNIEAIIRGWEARRIPHLRFVHHRPMGGSRGPLGCFINWGRAAYLVGYHPLFFLGKFLKHLKTFPYFWGSLVMTYHYLKGFFKREKRIANKTTQKFIKREQLKKLLGKPSIWS